MRQNELMIRRLDLLLDVPGIAFFRALPRTPAGVEQLLAALEKVDMSSAVEDSEDEFNFVSTSSSRLTEPEVGVSRVYLGTEFRKILIYPNTMLN